MEIRQIKDFYKDKRVLVTGHTGFKGSWLCSILLECGADVCGVGLSPNTNPALFNLLELEKKMESHLIDIRNLNELKKVFKDFQPEIVLHLAAQPLVIDSYKDPVYTFDVNIMGTVNLLECIRENSSVKSVINITTDKVYENKEHEDYKFKETDRLNGHDPYSNSKSCSELVTASYISSFFHDREISISTCRAGNVIGGGDFSLNRIIPDCIKYTTSNQPIILRNPNSVRPYQHVLEADMFYLLLAMKQYINQSLSGNYNIGPNDTDCITTGEVCALFCKIWGNDAKWEAIDYNGVHEANFLKLDSSKARKVLSWKPVWSVNEGISKTVEWTKVLYSKGNIKDATKRQINEYLDKEE